MNCIVIVMASMKMAPIRFIEKDTRRRRGPDGVGVVL